MTEGGSTPQRERRRLGPIRLFHRIGRGGMSTVYVGFHEDLQRFVAVKILFPEVAQEAKSRARFEQEGKVYARLRHPNIISFVESGVDEDDTPFLALEYVEGRSLHELIQDHGTLPPGDVLEVLEELTKALDHAHANGVIHRDIKPNNLIVNQDGILKLLDFGIAQLQGTSGISTATGQVLATYAYAPPEQNQGKEIDKTADFYAMGALAWEMLVGRRFITGNSPPQVVLQQTMGPPPPPSKHVPGLPEGFDLVIRKMCMPYPEDRYRSAGELAQALRELRRSFQGREELLTFYGDEVHEKWIMAKSAYYNEQHSLAASLAQYIVREQDDFAPAHFLIGKLYATRGLAINASDSFRRAIELSPHNEDYQLDFALALYRMGRYPEAQRELLRLLSHNPHNPLAAGFHEVVQEAVQAGKAAELADADELEEAPLWLEDGPRPAKQIPATDPGEGLGEAEATSRPGTLTGDNSRLPSVPVFPEVDESRARDVSRLIPGIAHLQLGAPREGVALLVVAAGLLASLFFLLVAWSPASWSAGVLRGLLSLAALAAASQLWSRAPADAYRRARRLNLRGGVTACPSLDRVRVNLGSDRGAEAGQVFELTRDDQVLGTIVLEEVDTYSACGPFVASPVSPGTPAPGDTARLVRDPS